MTQPLISEPCVFWMVWTKNGNKPWKRHGTIEAANAEAERLARACPGKKFIVLASTHKVHAAPEPTLSEFLDAELAGT